MSEDRGSVDGSESLTICAAGQVLLLVCPQRLPSRAEGAQSGEAGFGPSGPGGEPAAGDGYTRLPAGCVKRSRKAQSKTGTNVAHELGGNCWLIDFPTMVMRVVAMKICDCADPDGTNIFPSVSLICEETNASPSAVRSALAAFEQCGLLDVRANKFGNRYGRTTVVRELDTDLLRLITGQRRKGQPKIPSKFVLAQVEAVVQPGQTELIIPLAASPVRLEPSSKPRDTAETIKVWAIVPRPLAAVATASTPPGDGGVGSQMADPPEGSTPPPPEGSTPPPPGGVPLHPLEGYPSTTWTPPLQEVDPTPPGGGANPSLDPSLDPSPLPPRRRGGRAREGVDDWILKVSTPARAMALQVLLEPVIRSRRFDVPDPVFTLGTLADWASQHPQPLLERARAAVLTSRKVTVKPADIEDALKAEIKAAKLVQTLSTSPVIVTGTDEFREAIRKLRAINPLEAELAENKNVLNREWLAKLGVDLRRAA